MSTQGTSHTLHGPPAGELLEPPPWADLAQRLHAAERQSRWLKYTLFLMAPLLIYIFVGQELPQQVVRKETLVAADRMELFDEHGNSRMYMRVYSGVPVVQLVDESGMPRLSLGLRYDDSPFISLSDVAGQTRASLQIGAGDQPALKLFDESGEPVFSAN
ncbi:MAG: hypothetical protein GWP69_11160 [Gammaproteobacteria bacterium]|nr:hypothetical protein [Gammaproteobacteria bacterium]NCF81086.1 hypothetical protein [Pseudomonadota bacterium]